MKLTLLFLVQVSWYQTDFASNAFVQVHEISHNLGFNHSWKGSDEFGDSTDSTGNIGQWADDGPVACFNGAKTYFSDWYSEYYSSLDPGMNSYSKELVGLNDIVSKPSVSTKNNLVVRLSTTATDDLFIMYQLVRVFRIDSMPTLGDFPVREFDDGLQFPRHQRVDLEIIKR